MQTVAALLVELGKPLELVQLQIPHLQPGQTLVEIAYSGVCHTQVLECRGYRGEDKFLPHCLGHEGSGIVREVSVGVGKVKEGDRVILSWIKGSGADIPGTTYAWNGRTVNAGAITTFNRYAVISENRLTQLPADVPMAEAALLGCAVPTGVGAIFNTAQPRPGQSLAVFGTGGVGLCAVLGAAVAGCHPIVAIDVQDDKLERARRMGATHVINASAQDPVAALKKVCAGGVDYAIEASGRPAVMAQALASVRQQGGTAVVIGNARHGEHVELDPKQLNAGKRLLGTWGGDNVPDRDYPRYCCLLAGGRLDVSPLMSKPYGLADINQAIDDLEAGRVGRPLIDLSQSV
jgi:S-(hydroxymethyl)glutathione dehydrogenase/alcohol dehydrogenase